VKLEIWTCPDDEIESVIGVDTPNVVDVIGTKGRSAV
jgi:hypothetical protein